jgi:YqaJ-like recombinase protein
MGSTIAMDCGCKENEDGLTVEFCRVCAAVVHQTIEDDRGRLQLNPDWLQARCGFATGSRAADITKLVQKKKEKGVVTEWKPSAERMKYMDHVVAERLTGKPQGIRKIYSLDERRDLEPEARAAYAFLYNQDGEEVGFIHHLFINKFGCSPDWLCGDDGMIEIKNLDASTHVRLLEGDESVVAEYKPQILSGLSCTNREWLDFVSYCPQMLDEDLKLKVIRFWRNEDEINALECSVKQFLAEVDDRLRALQGRNGGLAKQLEESIELARKPNVVHARKGKVIQLVK